MELKEEVRPRERALMYGIDSLRNDELIAILLRSGTTTFDCLFSAIFLTIAFNPTLL